MKFEMPPLRKNEKGELRKVGFELEFTGVELDQVVAQIVELYGGEHERESGFLHKVTGTEHGEFTVEVDAVLLKEKAYEKFLAKLGIEVDELAGADSLEDTLAKIASTVVPLELSAPPLPLDRFGEIEKIRRALQKSNALGTEASLLYAFGMHINPETPATDVHTILRVLRAFFLLYAWVFEKSGIDFSRRVTPFIDEFPEDYVRLVLDSKYQPGNEQLVADYLEHNPTRNRPLDMLPLFAHLDVRILDRLADEVVKPRPAFHYRLPNCLLDDPSWEIAREWNDWIVVERLANQPESIRELSEVYLQTAGSTLLSFRSKWIDHMEQWRKSRNL